MQHCTDCGAAIDEDWMYCKECGEKISDGINDSEAKHHKTEADESNENISRSRSRKLGRFMAGFGAVVLTISVFAPWISAGFFQVTGLKAGGWIMLIEAAIVLACSYWFWGSWSHLIVFADGLFIVARVLAALSDLSDTARQNSEMTSSGLESVSVTPEIGIYLAVIGGLLMMGGALLSFVRDAVYVSTQNRGKSEENSEGNSGFTSLVDQTEEMDKEVQEMLRASIKLAESREVVTDTELKNSIYPNHTLGYEDADEWWDEAEGLLEDQSRMTRLDSTGRRWSVSD